MGTTTPQGLPASATPTPCCGEARRSPGAVRSRLAHAGDQKKLEPRAELERSRGQASVPVCLTLHFSHRDPHPGRHRQLLPRAPRPAGFGSGKQAIATIAPCKPPAAAHLRPRRGAGPGSAARARHGCPAMAPNHLRQGGSLSLFC